MHRATILIFLTTLCLSLPAQKPKQEQPAPKYESAWALISNEHDKNGDGKVTPREYPRGKERFKLLDRDQNGALTALDFVGKDSRRNRGRNQRRRDRRIRTLAPKVGAMAPGFTLRTVDGKKKQRLSTYKGKKPVALIFGSYT